MKKLNLLIAQRKISCFVNRVVEKELEKELNLLKETTKKPKSFHVKEALVRYLEDLEDIRDVQAHLKSKNRIKYHTSAEVKKKLGL